MHPETSSSSPEPIKEVPPVVPPSGRHIVQLFVVPGLIVLGVVLVFFAFSQFLFPWLLGVSRTPEQFLANLENANPDVRWRAANDLAQVLKRDEELASDAEFGLRLAELLRKSLDDLEQMEQNMAANAATATAREQQAERAEFQAKRSYALFLCACLANMSLPIGVPQLNELATKGRGSDPKTNVLIRRRAVWALANLGDNRKRFDKLPQDRKDGALAHLRKEQLGDGERGRWAGFTVGAIEGRQPLGVIAALAECAKSDDQFLRNLTAVALTFWEGDEQEKALADKTLVALARDTGWGQRIEIGEND